MGISRNFGKKNINNGPFNTSKPGHLSIKKDSKDPVVQRMLGTSGDIGSFIGLDNDWLVRAIKTVGNYGEIYNRHFGPKSKLNIPRGLNKLWNKGGLLYSLPIR